MTHAERDWRDGPPAEAAPDDTAGPAGRMNGNDPLVQDVHGDPLAEPAHEDDPLVEQVRENDPLVEQVHEGDPLVERVHEGDPLVHDVHDDPLAEPAPGGDPLAEPAPGGDPLAEPAPGIADGVNAVDGRAGTGQDPHDQLAGDGENERFVARWQEIQAGFVDEPRRAVQDADALVVDLMDRLARVLAEERARLESRPATGEDVSTEDLRQGLRRYRSLFERLLAV
jgi:hypothetical protein